MNNSQDVQTKKVLKIQYKNKKYEPIDEAQFLEESLNFFRNIKNKFLENEQSNTL